MSTRLILIRHGRTRWNLEKRYLSFTDIDLDKEGIEQAKKLRARLKKERIHKVYSSDTKRALHFARIAFKDLSIEKQPELKEMHFGIFEGLTHKGIIRKFPQIYNDWLNDPSNTDIPNGESLNDFRKRIFRIFKKIISTNDKQRTLAIVTHAGSIRIIINDILHTKNFWEITPDLASISIIELKNGKANILLFNDTSYLNG